MNPTMTASSTLTPIDPHAAQDSAKTTDKPQSTVDGDSHAPRDPVNTTEKPHSTVDGDPHAPRVIFLLHRPKAALHESQNRK